MKILFTCSFYCLCWPSHFWNNPTFEHVAHCVDDDKEIQALEHSSRGKMEHTYIHTIYFFSSLCLSFYFLLLIPISFPHKQWHLINSGQLHSKIPHKGIHQGLIERKKNFQCSIGWVWTVIHHLWFVVKWILNRYAIDFPLLASGTCESLDDMGNGYKSHMRYSLLCTYSFWFNHFWFVHYYLQHLIKSFCVVLIQKSRKENPNTDSINGFARMWFTSESLK